MIVCLIFTTAISWPTDETELTSEAYDAISALLTVDPSGRPGVTGELLLLDILNCIRQLCGVCVRSFIIH